MTAVTEQERSVESNASPLEIIEFVSESNLREVSWNQKFLEGVKQEYKIKHRQAVVFANVAQDRFRLVANFYGLAVLVLPPIDPQDRISLYLKISQFLGKMNPHQKVLPCLAEEVANAQERLERRKKLAKAASAGRR